jgi:hypothetical protein
MKKIIAVVVVILAGVCVAQSPRRVEVVAEVNLTNQTGTTRGTLYTPPQTGVFRVNFMIVCTAGSGDVLPGFSWTDDNGGEAYQFNTDYAECGSPHAPMGAVFIIKAIAGTQIDWEAIWQGGQTYDVYLALERIGPKGQ